MVSPDTLVSLQIFSSPTEPLGTVLHCFHWRCLTICKRLAPQHNPVEMLRKIIQEYTGPQVFDACSKEKTSAYNNYIVQSCEDIFQQNKYTLEERVVISRSYSNNLFDIIFLSTYRLLPFRDIISSLILQTLLEFLFSIVPSIDPNSG